VDGACETAAVDCDPACAQGETCVEGICETDIDDCADAPCLNGGTCTDGIDSYTCDCAPGYEGDTCETNIDDCDPDPCLNGGTCTDGVDGFTCECPTGFDGATCDVLTTCESLGHLQGSCGFLDGSECLDGEPHECQEVSGLDCWVQTETCGPAQQCVDPFGPSGAACEGP
jgi:hypothetical protein